MGQPTYISKTQLLKAKDNEINDKRTVKARYKPCLK